ncbi:MAG: hypothetical protein DRH15_06540 [Deltaproteobacteria bacterium]|nr:MAG: hypothetical protein DRH15_06540 [Deltaproteobacteria bacterium]
MARITTKTEIDRFSKEYDERVANLPKKGKLGYTCTYLPIEILEAAGLTPIRITPEPISEKADAFLDPNFCPYVRACLGKAMAGGYNHLDGIILTNTCDGMRRLFDAWAYYAPTPFIFFLDVPRKTDQQSVRYFQRQLEHLADKLEEHFKVDLSKEALIHAIEEANRTRKLYATLISQWTSGVGFLSYSEVLDIFQKEYEVPREVFNCILQEALEAAGSGSQRGHSGAPVFITGSILDGDSIINLVEEVGGRIAGVDCCLAERKVQQVPLEGTPIQALSRSYLNKLPCARMMETERRISYLVSRMEETEAKGLIYVALKFCDPYLYEFPYLKEELEARGIPVLFLEAEYRGRPGGGMRTRVQAFMEMLQRRG